jgi:hypothetical protein
MGKQFRPATTGDLREYIAILDQLGEERFERGGRGYKGHALHRPDRNPSLGVFIGREGGIVVTDHSQGKSWSAYHYLKELGREDLARSWLERFEEWEPTKEGKHSPKEKRLISRLPLPTTRVTYAEVLPAADEWEATARAKMQEAREAIENGEHPKALQYMEKRGLTPEYAYAAGFGAVEKGIAIPVYDEDVRLKNVKVRLWDERRCRYVYVFKDRGNGYYFSPDFAWKPMRCLVIMEGELNAGASYLPLDLPTIGIPGAGTGLSRKLAERIKECADLVAIITDQDDAGRQLAERIINQLVFIGYEQGRIRVPKEDQYHRDPMDILKDHGLDYLGKNLKKRIYSHGTNLKPARRASTTVAKAAAMSGSGLNTKRALANATGKEIVRRHARYVPQEEIDATSTIENYLTEEVMRQGVNPIMARKTVRRWMVMYGITGRTALFMIYEVHGKKTGSREFGGKFNYQRQRHPLMQRYRLHNERYETTGFDIERLLEDAVAAIKGMVQPVMGFFKKLAERINKERETFAAWMSRFPRLLGYILRQQVNPVATSPPSVAAA